MLCEEDEAGAAEFERRKRREGKFSLSLSLSRPSPLEAARILKSYLSGCLLAWEKSKTNLGRRRAREGRRGEVTVSVWEPQSSCLPLTFLQAKVLTCRLQLQSRDLQQRLNLWVRLYSLLSCDRALHVGCAF